MLDAEIGGKRVDAGACLFRLDRRRFAVPLERVREVVRMPATVPLPGAPAIVEGVVDLHGELAPVLDVRARFAMPAKPPTPADHLLFVHAGPRLVGFRVDEVEGVQALDLDRRSPLPTVAPGAPHMVGIARLPGGLVLIHDPAAFLAAEEAGALDAALRASAAARR